MDAVVVDDGNERDDDSEEIESISSCDGSSVQDLTTKLRADCHLLCQLLDKRGPHGRVRYCHVEYYKGYLPLARCEALITLLLTPWEQGGAGLLQRSAQFVGEKRYFWESYNEWDGPDARLVYRLIGRLAREIEDDLRLDTGTYTFAGVQLYGRGYKLGMGPHTDQQQCPETPIVTVSLFLNTGSTRPLRMVPSQNYRGAGGDPGRQEIELEHGSLYAIMPPTNEWWRHELPRRSCDRIAITFRRPPAYGSRPGSKLVQSDDPERENLFYEVTEDWCDCADFQTHSCYEHRRGYRCKHMKGAFPKG